MTRTLQEAESAVVQASVFGRPAPEWADRMVRESTGEQTPEDVEALFRRVGLCEGDARIAARGLQSGQYLSFTDAVHSRLMWDTDRRNNVKDHLVAEVAKTMPQTKLLMERRTAAQTKPRILERASAAIAGDGLLAVCLISEGQGSSGYYPASTLAEAASGGVFPRGLQCYVDHPTESEQYERPERSVRDLAGVLESAATYRDGALYADVRVFATHRDLITERASTIGMSIRGGGVIERQAVGGVTREVVTKLSNIQSVDFVTAAGRGGRILSVS